MRNGDFGFWASTSTETEHDSPLESDLSVDVAIVGGGYTGLWTAYSLLTQDPALRVAVFEAEHLGFGASGRNGGWLSAKTVGVRRVLARERGREGVLLADRLAKQAMENIVATMSAAQIDIEAVHGGWLQIARSESEVARLKVQLQSYRDWGFGPRDLEWLSQSQLRDELRMAGGLGALRSPDCYRINPLKLLHGVATLARRLGARIYVRSRVDEIRAGRIRIGPHVVQAADIVIATEGYTSGQPGRARDVLPLNSAMIATRPLTDAQWTNIGWDSFAGISGAAHTYFYGQRTLDGRIIIGGRGKPYRFGSGIDQRGKVDAKSIEALEHMLAELFPQIDSRADHAWCGVLGVLRDWSPIVEAKGDRIYEAGGFAGQGVTASKVAADALAALILDTDAPERELPWVRTRPRKWEPEPLRWIGANGLYRAYGLADVHEQQRGGTKTSAIARIADLVAGR